MTQDKVMLGPSDEMLEDGQVMESNFNGAAGGVSGSGAPATRDMSLKASPFGQLNLVYPVGKQLAFRSLGSNQIKFLKLPNSTNRITALALSHSQDLLAVAVQIEGLKSFEQHHLSVLFYSI